MSTVSVSVQEGYVTKMPDLTFFAGDTITIPFEFVDTEFNPIDLSNIEIVWYLCPYGRYTMPELIIKDSDIDNRGNRKIIVSGTGRNIANVNLSFEDTRILDQVKYSHQPVLIHENARGRREYLRAEGNIIFRPRIRDFGEI